jgi:excinuclease UvrABC nuclease subunit
MPERQLHLFQPSRPLALRLGDDFFHAAPSEPGVYIMTGADEQILYIGQSKNLRARLGTYKNARRDRIPRKVLRLVHEVRSITWEKCESAEAAILRESELLRVHRPRFNRANVYPTYAWFWFGSHGTALTLGWTRYRGLAATAVPEPQLGNLKSYGPFKSSASQCYGALLRLIWTVTHRETDLSDFPSGLLFEKPPGALSIRCTSSSLRESLLSQITEFLEGTSDSLLAFLRESLQMDEALSPFQQALQVHDLELLAQFYQKVRNVPAA